MSAGRTPREQTSIEALGDALRSAKQDRKRRRRLGLTVGMMISALSLSIAFPPAPRLVWNVSASAPLGLYLVIPGGPFEPGEMVIARLPEPWRSFAARRRYLPQNVPLVKGVAAGPGDEICAAGKEIFLEGTPLVERLERDTAGRPMPWWEGCRLLHTGQYFLLMEDSPQSFDGRYFGVTDAKDIIGPAGYLGSSW